MVGKEGQGFRHRMDALIADQLSKSFDKPIFKGVSFTLKAGEFISVVGRSGCGKSTLLEVLAGLQPSTSGSVAYSDSSKPPVLVFQEFNRSIFPWLTVEGNMDFITKRYHGSDQYRDATRSYLELVGLNAHRSKYPAQLSGGMKQRLAFARALSARPGTLLLDEPLGSLDASTRRNLQILLQDIYAKLKPSVVLVTHDVDEALFLSQRIYLMGGEPARFIDEVLVADEYPRNYLKHTNSSGYLRARHHLLEALMQ